MIRIRVENYQWTYALCPTIISQSEKYNNWMVDYCCVALIVLFANLFSCYRPTILAVVFVKLFQNDRQSVRVCVCSWLHIMQKPQFDAKWSKCSLSRTQNEKKLMDSKQTICGITMNWNWEIFTLQFSRFQVHRLLLFDNRINFL